MRWPWTPKPKPTPEPWALDSVQACEDFLLCGRFTIREWRALDDETRQAFSSAAKQIRMADNLQLAGFLLNGDDAVTMALGEFDGGRAWRDSVADRVFASVKPKTGALVR